MNTFNKASKITVTILLLALALSLGASSHWEVRCLDLSNGESSVIYTTDQYGERIFGAYANNLVIEEVTDTNRSYYRTIYLLN